MQKTSAVAYSNISASSGLVNPITCPLPDGPPLPSFPDSLWRNVLLLLGVSLNLDKGAAEKHVVVSRKTVPGLGP